MGEKPDNGEMAWLADILCRVGEPLGGQLSVPVSYAGVQRLAALMAAEKAPAGMVLVSHAMVEAAVEEKVAAAVAGLPETYTEKLRQRAADHFRTAIWLQWKQPELYAEIVARQAAEKANPSPTPRKVPDPTGSER